MASVMAPRNAAPTSVRAIESGTGWPAWTHIENFSAWHNVPIGTNENGMGGTNTEFKFNSPLHVRHIAMLGDLAKRVPASQIPDFVVRLASMRDPAVKQIVPELGKYKNGSNEKARRLQ